MTSCAWNVPDVIHDVHFRENVFTLLVTGKNALGLKEDVEMLKQARRKIAWLIDLFFLLFSTIRISLTVGAMQGIVSLSWGLNSLSAF